MRKNIDLPEDELISEIANSRISYNDFRSKYYHGESSRYKMAYNKLYDYGLVTEDNQIMKLSKAGNEIYLYKDFKKYENQSKVGMKVQNKGTMKIGDRLKKYFPHIAIILLILGILITLTLSL